MVLHSSRQAEFPIAVPPIVCITDPTHLVSDQNNRDVFCGVLGAFDLLVESCHGYERGALRERVDEHEALSVPHIPVPHCTKHLLHGREKDERRGEE